MVTYAEIVLKGERVMIKVELIANTPNPEEVIATAAKLCYSPTDINTLREGLTPEKSAEFVEKLMNMGHESPIEHVSFTFAIEGISRACYDNQTMVLTNNGWKYFKDVDIANDFICSLDDDNNIVYVHAIDKITYDYNGIMHKYKSTQVDLVVTPNHQMWVYDHEKRSLNTKTWKFIKSSDVTNCRYGFLKSSNGIAKQPLEKIEIPSVNRQHHLPFSGHNYIGEDVNYFLEFLGIWVTDGCISYGKTVNGARTTGNKVYISQFKPHVRKRIEFLLEKLNLHYKVYNEGYGIADQALFDWLENNFIIDHNAHKSYYLQLPRWMFEKLNKENIEKFLIGVFLGNGSYHVGGLKHDVDDNFKIDKSYNIYTCSKQFADDLVELALLSGICANIKTVPPRKRTFPDGKVYECKKQYVVSMLINGYHILRTKQCKSNVDYKGKVYCLELENYHRLYVKRNGRACWCGNCSHQLVRHRIASYSQQSQRYVNMNDFEYVTPPSIESNATIKKLYDQRMEEITEAYRLIDHLLEIHFENQLIANGEDPKTARQKAKKLANEDARYILPNACETKIIVTMNARSLYNFFAHRCCNRAQWEIREVAEQMYKIVYAIAPTLFSHAGASCVVEGKCPEGKMTCGKAKEMRERYDKIRKDIVNNL